MNKEIKNIKKKNINTKEIFKSLKEYYKNNVKVNKIYKNSGLEFIDQELDKKQQEELNNLINVELRQKQTIQNLKSIVIENDEHLINETTNKKGYSKFLPCPLIYKNAEPPKDLLIIKKDKKNSLLRKIADFWTHTYRSTTSFFKKIGRLLHIVGAEEKLDIEDYISKASKEIIFGKETKIAAEISDVYLTFKNPANPKEKNLVLRGTSLRLYEGYVHAIIGESGSGKSVITSLLYGLTGSNSIIEQGKVKLYGLEVQDYSLYNWEKSKLRGRVVSAVFQNPMSILDPTMKVGNQIMEGMLVNKIVKNKKEAYTEAIKYLTMTKISNPEKVMNLYPHELSGGMIQRIAIASIVSLKPKILVMDEPTTALDPTVQALVLDIIRELQEMFHITIAFITHDLGVVASIADFISIMYAGQIVEYGTREEILNHPQHPYTWGLISSMPDFNKGNVLETIRGAVPSNLNAIQGDAFAVRNNYALVNDYYHEPHFYQISKTHYVKSNLLSPLVEIYNPPIVIQKLWGKYFSIMTQIYGKQENWFLSNVEYEYFIERAKKFNNIDFSDLNIEEKENSNDKLEFNCTGEYDE